MTVTISGARTTESSAYVLTAEIEEVIIHHLYQLVMVSLSLLR
jgi:hypothetical protein